MTKRQVEKEIDEMRDEVLSELSPDERLALVLTATAKENDAWLAQLRETCPRKTYEQTDVQYTNRARLAFTLANRAVYDLHTTLLSFEWFYFRNRFSMVIEFCTDLDSEQLGPVVEPETRGAPGELLRALAVNYKGYERFAEEELGVSLETWLSVHSEGQDITKAVAEVLEEHDGLLAVAEDDFTAEPDSDGSDERVPVDEFADLFYRGWKVAWTDAVGES